MSTTLELAILRGSFRRIVGEMVQITRETPAMIFGYERWAGKWSQKERRYNKSAILCRNATEEKYNALVHLEEQWKTEKRDALNAIDAKYQPLFDNIINPATR